MVSTLLSGGNMPVGFPYTNPNEDFINTGLKLQKWRSARAKVAAGVQNTRILFIGDSTTTGFNGAGAAQWPSLSGAIAAMLNTGGVSANENAFCGFSVPSTGTGGRKTSDPRLIFTGAFTTQIPGGVNATVGGSIGSVAASGTMTFTPQSSCDTVNLFYSKYGGTGICSLQMGSGTPENFTSAGAGMATVTATGALGSAAVVTYASGNTVYVEGMEAYNSAVKSVNCMNGGWWGTRSENWISTTNPYSYLPMITYLAPSLTVIMPGINDWGGGIPISTFKSNIQTLITRCLTVGDCLIVTPAPGGNAPVSTQRAYIDALYELASSNNILIVDNHARWVDYTTDNALGYMSDNLHPNSTGFNDMARSIANLLLNA